MSKAEEVFDFTEVSDEVKSAIALSHEAVKSHLDSLPEVVVNFYKSAAEQLELTTEGEAAKAEDDDEEEEDENGKKKKKKDNEDDVDMTKSIELIKSALPGVIETANKSAVAAAIMPLKTEIEKSATRIEELENKLAQDELRETAVTLMPNGDKPSDELVSQLTIIRKSMDDKQWGSYLEGQRARVAQIEKSALFERVSNPQATAPGSAYEQLETIAKSIIEKSETKDTSKAFEIACEQNPKLYAQYRTEQAKQAVTS